MKNKLIYLLLVFFSIFFISCEKDESNNFDQFIGNYNIVSAFEDDIDITSQYLIYNVKINDNKKIDVSINFGGLIDSRTSTFKIKDNKLIEIYNHIEHIYQLEDDLLILTYRENDINVVITLKKEEKITTSKGVDFESILFGAPIEETKIFNYAPTIIIEHEDDVKVMHIWYCTNKSSGIIVDHIGYRKGILNDDKWEFSDEILVLEPTFNSWDGRHTCDPSVIKGEFLYNNENYNYMMAYLGCQTEDYSKNETGIAVSIKPEGPWIKVKELNPIVPWSHDGNTSDMWGTGMPSLINLDEKGNVLLFYSSSKIGLGVQHWDFSNLNNPTKYFTQTIIGSGILKPNGQPLTYLGLADFAYDPTNKRFYMTTYGNTKSPADITKTLVDSHAILSYIDNVSSIEDLLERLKNKNYEWNVYGYVGPEHTKFDRNHNLGLVRTPYGFIYQSDEIWSVLSTGSIDKPLDNIFTYRLRGFIFKKQKN